MPAPPPARYRPPFYTRARYRLLGAVFFVGAIVFAFSRLDLHPDLKHVSIAVLSGSHKGNYHAIVELLSDHAKKRGGRVDNIATDGSGDNLARLVAAAKTCDVQFALVQGGLPWPDAPQLELVGRLAKAESLFLLGKGASAYTTFADLAGKRIGVGPEGSGTALIAKSVLELPDFAPLGLKLSHHRLGEQIDLAARGELDLVAFVMDEDAPLIASAVREKGLELAAIDQLDVIARKFPFLRTGRIGAGQFDPLRMLPAEDRRVLRVDTLVVGNRCARRSQTIGLLSVLSEIFPDLVRHNKETPNRTGLELSSAAKAFFENGGPEVVDDYLPRAGDIMPPSNWVHVAFGVSVLFNLMGVGNRFRLWRIDAARVRAEQEVAHVFGPNATLGDIARMQPKAGEPRQDIADEVARVIHELEALASRSRSQSLSVLVPMGQEMAYRYQESLIHETLAVLRAYRERAAAARAEG